MKQDIYGGLRNALERGQDLEQAVRSFINAGYNEVDVREAAGALSSQGLTPQNSQVTKKPKFSLFGKKKVQAQKTQISQQQMPNVQSQGVQVPIIENQFPNRAVVPQNVTAPTKTELEGYKKKKDWKLIVLGSALLILVLVLIISIFLKGSILDFMTNLLG